MTRKTKKTQGLVASDGERPIIARINNNVSKIMYAIFFDGHGPVLPVPVSKCSSVTGQRAGSLKGTLIKLNDRLMYRGS